MGSRSSARHPGFPFDPRSTASVWPGDFWGIATRRGGWYCCGRVLGLSDLTSSRSLVVGLLDYCEPEPPSSDSIAGRKVVEWGIAHVKTIRETGGALLGHRPIEADGGIERLLGGRQLGDCTVWGYKMIEAYAHKHFGRHFPEHPAEATVRPSAHGDSET